MTTEQRIENIERELIFTKRQNRMVLIGSCFLMGIFALMWMNLGGLTPVSAQDVTPKVIRAQMFAVEDKDGKIRARLFMSSNGPVLNLCDKNNKAAAILSVPEDMPGDGPTLELRDANGKPRANLTVATNGAPALFLLDENNNSGVELVVSKDSRGLGLRDGKGKTGVSLMLFTDGSGIAEFGENKETTWQAPTNK